MAQPARPTGVATARSGSGILLALYDSGVLWEKKRYRRGTTTDPCAEGRSERKSGQAASGAPKAAKWVATISFA